MKKMFVPLLLVFCLVFCGCEINVNEMSSLTDLSKPYAGEYRLKKLQWGENDFLDYFDYVKLSLEPSGDFRIFYKTKVSGEEGDYTGNYTLDGEIITFTLETNSKQVSRAFSYENGTIIMEIPMGALLFAEFSMRD